jgi:hypothetical protein
MNPPCEGAAAADAVAQRTGGWLPVVTIRRLERNLDAKSARLIRRIARRACTTFSGSRRVSRCGGGSIERPKQTSAVKLQNDHLVYIPAA